MFCCKPDTLRYYTLYLDPHLSLFQQDQNQLSLKDKFNQLKSYLYLPNTIHFPNYQPSIQQLQFPQPFLNPQYQLSFSDQTRQLEFKELVPNPINKIWRVLTSDQSQTLNQGDYFSFDGFNFQVYNLPKPSPTLSTQITSLTDPQDKCRICFGNDTSEQNPILNFCKCSGSIKYMHLECCRQWIQQGSQTMEGTLYAMHVFYNGQCNICKQPWKKKIKHNKKQYRLFDFQPKFQRAEDDPLLDHSQPETKGQNIIFYLSTKDSEYESQDSEQGNYVLIFKLRLPEVINPEQEYSYRIGKSFEECDIVFEHMMIGSPIQCELIYKNNKLTIKDKNSNDGTNVLLKSSQIKNFTSKEGLFFRYSDYVYHVRGEKYLFSCFESNITYSIKYEQYTEPVPQ